jgi:ATP-binding cassette, subfamily C (CFTR/MRP), member 1
MFTGLLLLTILASMPGLVAPMATFFIFVIQAAVKGSESLNVVQAFTSLAIISLMTGPAGDLLFSIPGLTATSSCLDRIQKFLVSDSWTDSRGLIPSRLPTNSLDLSTNQTSGGISEVAIDITDLSASPAKEAPLAVRDLTLPIAQGSLTMITGPVGCGKTTLLKALLGELPYTKGSISVRNREMAYCSQGAWLPNGKFREIVCGANSIVDTQWYDTVIHACALEEDVSRLPNGHETVIGSRGITLSGGQKQRLVCPLYLLI